MIFKQTSTRRPSIESGHSTSDDWYIDKNEVFIVKKILKHWKWWSFLNLFRISKRELTSW